MAGQQALVAAFTAMQPKHSMRPYTREECVLLGKLYHDAYGELPTYTKMRRYYHMPDKQVMAKLFGGRPQYWQAIQEAYPEVHP